MQNIFVSLYFVQHFYDIFHQFIWRFFYRITHPNAAGCVFTSRIPTYSLSLSLSLLAAMRRIQCLLVTDINVPEIVDFRDNVTLSCSYDISGHTLNSVKWYKNDSEFFR